MAARLLFGVCAVLMAIAIANAAPAGSASLVVGLAKCADCTRKNMNAEAVFKGLQVAIKCKNVNGDYESKAVGKLDGSGAFNVPLAADLHGADCNAQLHSAAGKPCPGQEPSTIVPQSESEGIFVAVPGKTHFQSAECASATISGSIKKHIIDHFHKKPVPPKPKSEPKLEYHPPTPTYHPPTPTYGGSTPIYHPRALETSDTFGGQIKKHIIDHFHKKPIPPKPKPEPKPEYHPPTPTYGGSTPIYHPPALETSNTFGGKIKKHILDHFHKKHIVDHFHKKPVLPKPKPEPKPEYHPPTPVYHPPTPTYGGSPTPIYHPPALKASATFFGKIKKHILDHFHKKPTPPKPKPEPKPEYHPLTPTYHYPTPTYGGPTPIYHPPAKH